MRVNVVPRTFIKPRFTGSRVSLGDIEEDVPIVRVNRFLFDFHFKGGLIARNRDESSVLTATLPARANIFIRSLKSHSDVPAEEEEDAAVPRPRPLEILSSSPVNRKVGSFAFVRINGPCTGLASLLPRTPGVLHPVQTDRVPSFPIFLPFFFFIPFSSTTKKNFSLFENQFNFRVKIPTHLLIICLID